MYALANGGKSGVTAVTGASPIESSGGATPVIGLALAGQAEGDILYFDGTQWNRLPAGTAGQVLTVGEFGPPEWVTQPPLYAFVFRPRGVASGNIYTDFGALYAALPPADAQGKRAPSIVYVDDTLGTALAPVAAYNLDAIEWRSAANYGNDQGGAILQFAAGASATASTMKFAGNIQVQYLGTAAPFISMTSPNTELNITITEQAQVSCTEPSGSAAPFIAVDNESAFAWITILSGLLGDQDLTNVTVHLIEGGCTVDALATGTVGLNALLGAVQLNWETVQPDAQDAAVTITQFGGWFTNQLVVAGGITGGAGAGQAYKESASGNTGIGASGTIVLSAAELQYMCVLLVSGGLTGDVTVQLPNNIGEVHDFDLRGVVFNGHNVFFGTGSGTTTSINATQLAATGANGCRVIVAASNVVSRLS